MLSLSAGPQGIAWHHHRRSSIWWFLLKITSLQVQCKQSSALEHIKIKLVWKIVRDSLAGVNDLHVYSEELGVLLVGLGEDEAWQIFKERKWVLLAIETVCTENGCDRGGFDISVTAPVVGCWLATFSTSSSRSTSSHSSSLIIKVISLSTQPSTSSAPQRLSKAVLPLKSPCDDKFSGSGGDSKCLGRPSGTFHGAELLLIER